MHRQGTDRRQLARLMRIAAAEGVPLIASNDALYATPEQRPLHDVVTCIREGETVASAVRLLADNDERYLKSAKEMARHFRDCSGAVTESANSPSHHRLLLGE